MGRKTKIVNITTVESGSIRNSEIPSFKEEKGLIIKDSKEQQGWVFPEMRVRNLKTGDYSLTGYEDVFTIERKGSSGEFAGNLFEDRFERELDRMDKMKFPFLLLEFQMEDILNFPHNSKIPQHKWSDLRMTPKLYLKLFLEMQMRHRAKVIFCGYNGQEVAESIFKRVLQ